MKSVQKRTMIWAVLALLLFACNALALRLPASANAVDFGFEVQGDMTNSLTDAGPLALHQTVAVDKSGSYLGDVGLVFGRYEDAIESTLLGMWQLARHPVQSAQGIWYAGSHPVQTWGALKTDYSGRWNSGLAGKGSIVGEGLITIATLGSGFADDAGNVGRVGNTVRKLDTVLPDEVVSKIGLIDDSANFAQKTFRETFSEGGRFAGQTVDDVAAALRSGNLSPADVPIEFFTRGSGQSLISNTRSAQALTRAGVPRNLWNGVDISGDAAALRRLAGQLKRNKLSPNGTPSVRVSNGGN